MDHADVAYGVYCANAAHTKRPFAPIEDPTRSGHSAVVPFTGEGNLQVTITAGQVIRVAPSAYTYDGGCQYAIGTVGTPVSGSSLATTSLLLAPAFVPGVCGEVAANIATADTTTSRMIPWFGTDLAECGITTGGPNGPQGQLSCGYLTVEAICSENSSAVGCAVGQHEVRGWGAQNDNHLGFTEGSLLPGHCPSFTVENAAATVYGGTFSLKQRDTIVGSTSVARHVWAVPVVPTTRTYMSMANGTTDSLWASAVSSLLTGSEGGSLIVYNDAADVNRNPPTVGSNPYITPLTGGAVSAGDGVAANTYMKKRVSYATPNLYTCAIAGEPVVEVHCLTGTAILNIRYKMHYNVYVPTTHPNYETAILSMPTTLKSFYQAVRAPSHAGSASTLTGAVSSQKVLSSQKYGGSHPVMDAFHQAMPPQHETNTRPPIFPGSGLKPIVHIQAMSPAAIMDEHIDAHPSLLSRAGSLISTVAGGIWSGVKYVARKAEPLVEKYAVPALEFGGALAAARFGQPGVASALAIDGEQRLMIGAAPTPMKLLGPEYPAAMRTEAYERAANAWNKKNLRKPYGGNYGESRKRERAPIVEEMD